MNHEIDKAFEGQKIYLDYTIWERCTFLDCEIIVEYGMYHLKSCDFVRCNLTLTGRAMRVAKIMYLFFPDKVPPLFEENVKNPFKGDT